MDILDFTIIRIKGASCCGSVDNSQMGRTVQRDDAHTRDLTKN